MSNIYIIMSAMALVYVFVIITMLMDVRIASLSLWKKILLLVGLPLVIVLNIFLTLNMDEAVYLKLYPLMIQFPVFVVFLVVAGNGFIKTFFVIITAIVLTFPYRIISVALFRFNSDNNFFLNAAIVVICGAVLIFLVYRLMKPNFNYVIRRFSNIDVLKFCIIPVFYNMLVYSLSKYRLPDDMITTRIFLFLIAIAAYFLLMDVFRTTREKQMLQYENDMVSLEMETAKQQLDDMRTIQEKSIIYRHDLRHHFALIGSFAEEGATDKIKEYIMETQNNMSEITPIKFCENDIVNLIFSSFYVKANNAGVALIVKSNIPKEQMVSDTELCAIFSNGLENAISAAANVNDGREKVVNVNCKIHKNKLLIHIENTFVGDVQLENGLPKSNKKGHGFGVKSIVSIVQKYDGCYSFEKKDGVFSLKLVLPLQM